MKYFLEAILFASLFMLFIQPISAQQRVRFTNVATGERLDGNMEGLIYPHPAHDGNWQKWYIDKAGRDANGDFYYIYNYKTNRYLAHFWWSSPEPANNIYGMTKMEHQCTQWYIREEGNGIVTITNRQTGANLDNKPGDIYPLSPNTGNYQKWKMTPWYLDDGGAKECKIFFWWCQ